jgi:hypothetical protein
MLNILTQSVLPFIFSSLIVILITVIAEKYGTKVGGILGTLPSTIIIAFIFIAINKGINFASQSVAIVPAEMGINIIFLLFFVLLAYRSIVIALILSLSLWTILSTMIYFLNITNIFLSILIFVISLIFTFVFLEYVKKIPSTGKVNIHYTPIKIILRGVITGTIISISVLLSNISASLSGIFSVFPAIITSTMIISTREHGPEFSAGIAKSMIFGCTSVMSYAVSIHFLYSIYGITIGTIVAFSISFCITMILFKFRSKIK